MNRKQSPAPRQAIALSYDGQAAPTLSAKGDAELAEAILAIARDYEVPIYENAELVRLLARLELGDAIPEALYRTIAEIIAFAWHLKASVPRIRAGRRGWQPDAATRRSRRLSQPARRNIRTHISSRTSPLRAKLRSLRPRQRSAR